MKYFNEKLKICSPYFNIQFVFNNADFIQNIADNKSDTLIIAWMNSFILAIHK